MPAALAKPAGAKPCNGKAKTWEVTWCCSFDHRGAGGIVLGCTTCGNTGHRPGCPNAPR